MYYNGRSDGIGNRLEEVIRLEAVCAKLGMKIVYLWNNRYDHRHYPILFEADNVKITSADGNLGFFTPPLEVLDSITQADMLVAAKKIRPKFGIHFSSGVKPLGVHIRGTDRIGKNHPHFIKDYNQFHYLLSKTLYRLNRIKPAHVFVCADDERYRRMFINNLDKSIRVVEARYDRKVSREYADFFALTLCEKVYMCSQFSSFSICAALIGNIPVVSFSQSEEVARRYQALFDYDLADIEAKEILDFQLDRPAGGSGLKRLAPIKDRFYSLFRRSP